MQNVNTRNLYLCEISMQIKILDIITLIYNNSFKYWMYNWYKENKIKINYGPDLFYFNLFKHK